jgi:hypothetical protein
MPDARDDLRRRLLLITPALLYIVFAVVLLAMPERPLWAMCGTVVLGLVAIGLAGPLAVRRLRGFVLLPEITRALKATRDQIFAGHPEPARARLEELAGAIVDRLGAGRALVLTALANARMHCGELEHARELLDHLEASGWLRAFALRRHRPFLFAAQAMARTQLGDLPGAERFLREIQGDGRLEARAARAVLAARRGAADVAELEALTTSTDANHVGLVRMARLLLARALPADDPRRATLLSALRGDGPRPMHALERGWPELYAFAKAEGLVGPPP